MDIELKKKWAEALKSGNFKQGTGYLYMKPEDSYCCLGVLCKTLGAEWGPWNNGESDPEVFEEVLFGPVLNGELLADGGDEVLSADFRTRIELSYAQHDKLIEMNDGKGSETSSDYARSQNFEKIADFILSDEFDNLEY